MTASAFDIWVACLTFAESATVLAFFGNAVTTGVCAFLRFGHDQDLLQYLTAQRPKSFEFFRSSSLARDAVAFCLV